MCVYIYIYIERERDIHIHIYIYIYAANTTTKINQHVKIAPPPPAFNKGGARAAPSWTAVFGRPPRRRQQRVREVIGTPICSRNLHLGFSCAFHEC